MKEQGVTFPEMGELQAASPSLFVTPRAALMLSCKRCRSSEEDHAIQRHSGSQVASNANQLRDWSQWLNLSEPQVFICEKRVRKATLFNPQSDWENGSEQVKNASYR